VSVLKLPAAAVTGYWWGWSVSSYDIMVTIILGSQNALCAALAFDGDDDDSDNRRRPGVEYANTGVVGGGGDIT